MKIYLGSAGIPTVSKDRSTIGGIKCISELGLSALEVQFVRRVAMSSEIAKEAGKLSKDLNIKLSVHAPYAINLCSEEMKKVEASKNRIIESAEKADLMNANIVVFHPGYYGKLSPERAIESVKQACSDMVEEMKSKDIEVKLGLETTGKQAAFGTLDEIINICKEVKDCRPVIDFAHLNCRCAGCLRREEDYANIFKKLEKIKIDCLHTHFTCAEFSVVGVGKGNERFHLELKENKPPFEPLAKEILKRNIDITIISESPILEQDSLKMKKIFEDLGYKSE
ncbi:MAG: TIM barrel protein [Candidatus Aenigmatarchaeota archaeon]